MNGQTAVCSEWKTVAHTNSSISFDGSNKKDTNKISHSAFMNNYRSFLFLYFDRTCFDRPKKEIVFFSTLP